VNQGILFQPSVTNRKEAMDSERLKLMCILAHPDDESLGMGGVLARYAAEGVETQVITATRGQRGWPGDPAENPGLEALGQVRAAELQAATGILEVRELVLLDYVDGDLDQESWPAAVEEIAGHLRRLRPQVVLTFDPFGAYGHPDHIAISQLASSAVVAAAGSAADSLPAHQVSKLYYMAEPAENWRQYERVFGPLVMLVNGHQRASVPWPDWAITTRIDAAAYRSQVWQAVACHRSQLPAYEKLLELASNGRGPLFTEYTFYRAFSLVNGGPEIERDLFAGLR
jgi:LmbE family N-acetylglucosaminyl deacetylase